MVDARPTLFDRSRSSVSFFCLMILVSLSLYTTPAFAGERAATRSPTRCSERFQSCEPKRAQEVRAAVNIYLLYPVYRWITRKGRV